MNRKAQTALEYLMTYGWAILIVIIVVGALYALGLTQPCRWVGTQIREFADFRVENPKLTVGAPNTLAFDLSSLKPQTIELTGITVSGDASGNGVSPTLPRNQGTTATRYTVSPLTLIKTGLTANSCYSVDVTISYNVSVAEGAEETFTSVGKISGVAS